MKIIIGLAAMVTVIYLAVKYLQYDIDRKQKKLLDEIDEYIVIRKKNNKLKTVNCLHSSKKVCTFAVSKGN